jgi:hypothetical protein
LPAGSSGSICAQTTSGIRQPPSRSTSPMPDESPVRHQMENFAAPIGRRWTFMAHMELHAYRDRLFRLCPSEHQLKPWPTRPQQENGALLFRDIDVDFNSPLASAPLITDCILPLCVTTEDLNRVVRHGAPQRPGETANRPADVGPASEKDLCALDISPSRGGFCQAYRKRQGGALTALGLSTRASASGSLGKLANRAVRLAR